MGGHREEEKREEKIQYHLCSEQPCKGREWSLEKEGGDRGSLLCDACHPVEGRCEGQRVHPQLVFGPLFLRRLSYWSVRGVPLVDISRFPPSSSVGKTVGQVVMTGGGAPSDSALPGPALLPGTPPDMQGLVLSIKGRDSSYPVEGSASWSLF